MASMRPRKRTGLAQLPVAASCRSQRAKSSPEAKLNSSPADARGCRLSPVRLRVVAGTVMERRPPRTLVPRNRCAAVLHRRQACHDLPSRVQARCASQQRLRVPRDATDTGPALARNAPPVSLLQIAPTLPARVIRLPPPSVGNSPAAPAIRRQIRSSSGMAQIGHASSIPRHFGRQTGHARPGTMTDRCHQTCHWEMASEPGSRAKARV